MGGSWEDYTEEPQKNVSQTAYELCFRVFFVFQACLFFFFFEAGSFQAGFDTKKVLKITDKKTVKINIKIVLYTT